MDPSKLLLVDSDARSVRVLEVSLKKVGYEVSTAQTIQTALVASEASPPDLIITEVNLADGRGFDLCKTIRENMATSRTAVIFLAEEATPEAKIAAINVGADAFLTKPVFVNEILAQIQSLLEKKRTDSITRRERPGNLSGNLANMGVVDLLQLMETGRKSGIVHVSSDRIKSGGFVAEGQERGTMFFREGQVIDSRLGKVRGVEAVYRTLLWDDGVFEIEFKNVSREDVVRSTTQSILLEGMRRVDEWSRFSEVLPPMSARLAVDYGALGRAFDEVPAAMRPVLHLFDGKRSLFEVVNDAPMSDTEALAIVSRLHDHGVLQRSQTQTKAPAPAAERSDEDVEAWLSSPQGPQPEAGALPSALGRAVIPSPHTPSEILQADDPLQSPFGEIEPDEAANDGPEATELPEPLPIPDRPSVVLSRHTVPANRSVPLTKAPEVAEPEPVPLTQPTRSPSIVRQRVSSVVVRAPATSNVLVPPSSSLEEAPPVADRPDFDPEITVTDGKPYRPTDSEIENAVDAAAQADEVFRSVRSRSPSYVLAAQSPWEGDRQAPIDRSGAWASPPAESTPEEIAPTMPPPAGFVEREAPQDPISTTLEEDVTPEATPAAVLARLPPVREEQPTEELSNFRNEFFEGGEHDLGIESEPVDWKSRALGMAFVAVAVAVPLILYFGGKKDEVEEPPPIAAELGKKTTLPSKPSMPSQPSLRPAPGTPIAPGDLSGLAGPSGAVAAPSGAPAPSGAATPPASPGASTGPTGPSGTAALAPPAAPPTAAAPPAAAPPAAAPPKKAADSAQAASLTKKGDAALSSGKIGAAKGHFRRALSADPSYANAHAGLALVYLEEGKDKSAKYSAWKALKQNRGTARAHLVLGMVATNGGKMGDAKKAYERFLKYQPKGAQADEVRRILKSMP